MRFSGFKELLSHFALTSPDAPALIYEDSEIKTCSYSMLHQVVTERAESFRSSGNRCIGILISHVNSACSVT